MGSSAGQAARTSHLPASTADQVSEARWWRRHMEMAELGAIPGNGVNRQALSEEDTAARQLLIGRGRRVALQPHRMPSATCSSGVPAGTPAPRRC